MEQKIKIINCLFFKVDQPRWALFSSFRLSWPCSWCMVVNIFFWAFLRLSRSPSGSSSGPSYNWLDVDRQFIWVWLWLSRSPSGPSRFGWLSIKTLTGSNSWVVAARCSNCAAFLDSSPLGMFSQTASSGDRVAIDINGVTASLIEGWWQLTRIPLMGSGVYWLQLGRRIVRQRVILPNNYCC